MCMSNESGRLRALVVDDEGIERRGLSMLFARLALPYDVEEASNGEEAMAKLRTGAFDVLLTDIQMPFMDGLSLSHEVRKLFPEMPIIVFTAHADFDKAQRAIQERVSRYLLKPVNVLEFKEVMEETARSLLKDRHLNTQPTHLEAEIRAYRQNEEQRGLHHTVSLALEMIRVEYMTDLTLRSVADRLYVTPSYFSTLFGRETGKSFVHYLNDYRLKQSQRMLIETSLPVKEIGSAVGFSSVSYFIQRFKEHFGCTPQQYRSAQGEKNAP